MKAKIKKISSDKSFSPALLDVEGKRLLIHATYIELLTSLSSSLGMTYDDVNSDLGVYVDCFTLSQPSQAQLFSDLEDCRKKLRLKYIQAQSEWGSV